MDTCLHVNISAANGRLPSILSPHEAVGGPNLHPRCLSIELVTHRQAIGASYVPQGRVFKVGKAIKEVEDVGPLGHAIGMGPGCYFHRARSRGDSDSRANLGLVCPQPPICVHLLASAKDFVTAKERVWAGFAMRAEGKWVYPPGY